MCVMGTAEVILRYRGTCVTCVPQTVLHQNTENHWNVTAGKRSNVFLLFNLCNLGEKSKDLCLFLIFHVLHMLSLNDGQGCFSFGERSGTTWKSSSSQFDKKKKGSGQNQADAELFPPGLMVHRPVCRDRLEHFQRCHRWHPGIHRDHETTTSAGACPNVSLPELCTCSSNKCPVLLWTWKQKSRID